MFVYLVHSLMSEYKKFFRPFINNFTKSFGPKRKKGINRIIHKPKWKNGELSFSKAWCLKKELLDLIKVSRKKACGANYNCIVLRSGFLTALYINECKIFIQQEKKNSPFFTTIFKNKSTQSNQLGSSWKNRLIQLREFFFCFHFFENQAKVYSRDNIDLCKLSGLDLAFFLVLYREIEETVRL